MQSIKTYEEAVNFLYSLSNASTMQTKRTPVTTKKRLKKVSNFLEFLGNPQNRMDVIHIAGTSGKGSLTEMLHNIFLSSGKKTGSYTSPHVSVFVERIKIDGKYIGEKDFIGLVNFFIKKLDQFVLKTKEDALNFYELSFCMAVYFFYTKGCEVAVIETGLGGRADASNSIKKPAFTIITNIGRDHLDIFSSLKKIAKEKAGIIKPGVPILTGERDTRWIKMFKRESKKSKLEVIDYKLLKDVKTNLDGTTFQYNDEQYKLKIPGAHQAKNATLAIECAKYFKINKKHISRGLGNTFMPARMEIIKKSPLIILDGAHNEDKLNAAIDFLKTYSKNKGKKYLILGMAKNKRIKKSFLEMIKYFDYIYFTRFSNPFRKAFGYSDWKLKLAKQNDFKLYYNHCAKDALAIVLGKLKKDDLLIITGSLFLAGELRKQWYPDKIIIKNRKSK